MQNIDMISALMFMTLGGVVLLAVLQLIWFMRRRSSRNAAKNALLD